MLRILIAVAFVAFAGAASAERRVALVMGADDYRLVRKLDNAVNDARSVEQTLQKLGFEVTLETDRDLRRMRRALEDFRDDAAGADVALVFFAGHGVEISGVNRLLPVDADASSVDALKGSSLPLEEVRRTVAAVGRIGLIMLDACRNDPFGAADGSGRGVIALAQASEVKPGLGRMGRAENILFAFSAAPGQTAQDGPDGHPPFTAALAKYLGTDGLEIRSVLTLVQQEVYDLSRGKQLPYVESGLPKLFFAAAGGEQLPERERLLLAMADITPDLRAEVERVAAARDMPLAPLYGALVSADLAGESLDERAEKLAEAADSFVKVREELRTLASGDPTVTQLRQEAEQQLSLGAFGAARATLTQAAGIDDRSRQALKANFIERTLSEAATHYLKGSAASADLQRGLAIADYEKAAALYDKVDREDIAAEDRTRQIVTWESLGDIQLTIGNLAAAREAFEARHRISARRAAANPSNLGWQHDLSLSHDRIGDLLVTEGNLGGALEAYRAGLGIAARLVASDPANMELQRDLSLNHERIGDVQVALGDLSEALAAFRAGIDIGVRLAATNPGDSGLQLDLSVGHIKIGDILIAQGNLPAAADAYQAGLDVRTRLAANEPGNLEWQRDLSIGYIKIGDVRAAQGDLPGAMQAYQASLDIATRLAASDPANTGWQRDLAVSLVEVGGVRVAEGDLAGALEAYQANLAIAARLAASDPGNTQWQSDLALSHNRIGDVQHAQGDLPSALAAYQADLDIETKLAASDPGNTQWQRDLSISHDRIGNVRVVQGSLPEARAYQASLDIRTRLVATDPGNTEWQRDLSVSYNKVGDVGLAEGDLPTALQAYQASLDIVTRLAAIDPANVVWQRDLVISDVKLAEAGDRPAQRYADALAIVQRLEADGRLAPSDAGMPGELESRLDAALSETAKS